MDKIKTILTRTIFPLGIACIFLLSTACDCEKDNEGGSGTESGTESGNKQPFFSDVYPEKQDISVNYVNLAYDMRDFLWSCEKVWGVGTPWNTITELQSAHNISAFGPGSIDFNSLLCSPFWGVSPPYAAFCVWDPECLGNWFVGYDYFDFNLCIDKKIKDAPKFTKHTCWIEFGAQTITTSDGVAIKWNQTLLPNIASDGKVSVDIGTYGVVDAFVFGFLATRTKAEDNEIAVRREGNKYVPIENTVKTDISKGNYTFKASKRDVPFSDILAQGVCIGGQVRNNYRWFPPEIVELVKKK